MTRPELVPADLPTLPTAQLLARLSAEPGRAEMTLDTASPWVAGVIVRTPRLLLALHAVSPTEAQIIAVPRQAGLVGSGDAQLQALLANAAPQDDAVYRSVPPAPADESGPPPLDLTPAPPAPAARQNDVALAALWFIMGALSFGMPGNGLGLLVGLALLVGGILALLGVPRTAALHSTLRMVSLVSGGLGLALLLLFGLKIWPLVALVSLATGLASRVAAGMSSTTPAIPAPVPHDDPAPVTQALPAPQQELIEVTRLRLTEYLEVAERSGSPRDAYEARQALEVHLPEMVERWEALPSWRRRDEAPLRRTLEQLASASLPDTTTRELEWDATERFIEQKARARTQTGGLNLGLNVGADVSERQGPEPLTPPARIQEQNPAVSPSRTMSSPPAPAPGSPEDK